MRNFLFTTFMIGIEILVVLHWFVFTENPILLVLAMVAGIIMCLMALADFLLMIEVLRMKPGNDLHREELKDMAKAEGVWVFVTLVQIVFFGASIAAGVYWMSAALAIGQGAELVAFYTARNRVKGFAAG